MSGHHDNQEGRNTMRYERSVMTAPRDALRRIVGCGGCAGHLRPGYVREWETDPTSPTGTRAVWRRCPEQCTAESRQASVDRQLAERFGRPVGTASAPAASAGTFAPAPETAPAPAAIVTAPPARRSTSRRPAAPRAARSVQQLVPAVAVDVDTDGRLVVDVDGIGAPESATADALFAWLGTVPPIGVSRLHDDSPNRDGTVCLSAAALAALKVPVKLPTGKRADQVAAKFRKAADAYGIELSETIGAGFKAWRRRGEQGPRLSVKVIVTPWLGQGDDQAKAQGKFLLELAGGENADARSLARRLRQFATDLGIGPGVTSAVTSWQLLDALRPRVRWVKDDAGRWSREERESALPDGDTAVPVAAGSRHPLTRERLRGRLPVCEEEDLTFWAREALPEEAARPWAVALDVCTAYLSVPETLRLPSGPLVHTDAPAWDAKCAGLWLCDFTGLEVEPVLPHPATLTGLAPAGPGWYATPTVDYMAREYGFDPATIGEAYVSTHTAPILREWLARIRTAYKGAMATLGVVDDMDDAAFLTAWSSRKDTAGDPAREDAAVLVNAYKAIYKGGIGKWADSAKHLADDAWADRVAAAWHYRPEIRFHVVAAARIAFHRRMRKTYRLTGRAPLAVNKDQAIYAADVPHPGELLPKDDAGRPVPGTLRLGSAPGSFKLESSVPMTAVLAALAEREHPSRITHDYTPAGTPVITDSEA